ncbi:hypothetical protein [Ornithinibacillus californiensis]|uniref:hypothetical protein n=1 Tax=Ornithinibacillus californiensis TaxID=161536 RepID=UPI00064DAFFE|nr:hypothetical protein [Ornithinibacillus californiensis]
MVGVLSLILITSLILILIFTDKRDKRKVLYGGIVGLMNLVVVAFVYLIGSDLNINDAAAYSMAIIASIIFLSGTITICTLKIIEVVRETK